MLNGIQASFVAVICAALMVTSARADDVRPSHPEFPEENAALVAATAALFDRIEAGAKPQSKTPVFKAPFKIVRSSVRQDKADALTVKGPVSHLTGYNITWYPTDRLLGIVDFMGTWDGNKNLVCGYLTWDMTQPDSPVLQAVAVSFVDVSHVARGTSLDIENDLLTANCAFSEIEQNYRFFDVTG